MSESSVAFEKLSPGDRRDDADFVALFHGGVLIFEETDIFIVEEDVDEATDIALFVTDALSEAGIGSFEAIEDLGDRFAVGGNDFFFSGEFTEGSWDANGCGHWIIG
jgi:hypothetical protein